MILLLLVSACKAPPELPVPETPDGYPELAATDEAILDAMGDGLVPGLAACIVKDGVTAWCNGYGWADIEAGLEVTPDTPFMLASVSKLFTATAVMQVIEDGDLGLDDDVSNAVGYQVRHPDFPSAVITPRQALSHSSGIADNWDVMEALYVQGDSPVELGAYLRDYLEPGGTHYDANDNFTAEGPGDAREYSNMAVSLAGQLVEDAGGAPLDDHSDTRIFTPLGMDNTGWHLADFNPDDVAMPYDWRGGEWRPFGHYGYPDYPDGQLRSSAESVAKFVAMMEAGGTLDGQTVISTATAEQMLEEQHDLSGDGQGLGWYYWDLDGERLVGHNGGDNGTSTEAGYRVGDGTGFVVLMNGAGRSNTLADVERALFAAADEL